jgi:two-component system chemotaxis response regulator CheY
VSTRVLAVDDSRTMRDMVRHALSSAGFEVILAEDGQHGLEVLEEAQPDLIITDINMPRLDGFGFIEAVRKGQVRSTIPILVLTTESAADLKERAKKAGATGWIVKPFDREKLIAAIRKVTV